MLNMAYSEEAMRGAAPVLFGGAERLYYRSSRALTIITVG